MEQESRAEPPRIYFSNQVPDSVPLYKVSDVEQSMRDLKALQGSLNHRTLVMGQIVRERDKANDELNKISIALLLHRLPAGLEGVNELFKRLDNANHRASELQKEVDRLKAKHE